MNFASFERAQIAAFAYRQARHTGSIDCMKAICYVLRNRVKAGWGDGTWIWVMEQAEVSAGNQLSFLRVLDAEDRLLQLLVRDIDDIYLGQSEDNTKAAVQDALFYQFIDKPLRTWFNVNIVSQPSEHPRIAHIGPIAFYK